MRLFLLLFLSAFIIVQLPSMASVFPGEGARLHYRLIGFTFPVHEKATGYLVEISEYDTLQDGSVHKRKIETKQETTNRIIVTVPAFGKQYSWQVKYLKKRKVIGKTSEYHFSVMPNPFSDSSIARVDIIDSASAYKDLLVFFDNTRSLYNLAGEAVWYLPVIPGVTDNTCGKIRDLKLTKDGTITFMTEKNVHEIDYNGHVLWSAPVNSRIQDDTIQQYHHEITKITNGNYMVIGNKITHSKQPPPSPGAYKEEMQTICGTLLEYNSQGEIVWSWNSCEALSEGDPQTHFNSFYFDEKNSVFYTSYRNISKVIKAAYPSGKVLAIYGTAEGKDRSLQNDGMFYSQHNCGINSDGNLCLFNNNFNMFSALPGSNKQRVSTVAVFREPVGKNDTLQKIWEFPCSIDTFAAAITSGGGSVYELDRGDYLVCMGLANRDFIVSGNKKIIWNVITRQKEGTWVPLAGYRISPVRKKDLESLLFR